MDHIFWRERRAEAEWNRGPSAHQPIALPVGQIESSWLGKQTCLFVLVVILWETDFHCLITLLWRARKIVYRLIRMFLSTEIFSKRRKIFSFVEEKPE